MPAVIGSQLHPFGNKGPDLIETIRMERQSGPHVRVNPHPAVDQVRKVPIRDTVGAYRKMWMEPRWDRPMSALPRVEVHAPDVIQDLLAATPVQSEVSCTASASQPSHLNQATCNSRAASAAQRARGKRRPQSAVVESTSRDSIRYQETMQSQQVAHQRLMQRLQHNRERAAAKANEDFNAGWEYLREGEETIVAAVTRTLDARQKEDRRRESVLCREWHEEVFNKILVQIEKEVNRRERKGFTQTRWREAQADYIKALEGKEKGVFRDTVIENEYDPFQHCDRRITYSTKHIKDPLKMSASMHENDGGFFKETQRSRVPKHDTRLPVTLWSHLEATPFGHYSKLESKRLPTDVSQPRSQIALDHYTFAKGPEVVNREFHKPKRTYARKR
ncbi:MAG: hypothetical protein SGPRY_007488 [Prymnesium sp.]